MDKKDLKNKEAWWAPALQIFSEVSSWIAGPIVISLIAGKYLDNRYGTKPWIFLGFTAIAFMISCFGIYRVVTRYMKKVIEDKKD